MDHRNRRAPVALARDAPVLQPVLNLPFADPSLLRVRNHLRNDGRRFLTIPRTGVDQGAVVRRRRRQRVSGRRRFARADDDADRQLILAGKLEVALVVGRHRHDRAGAVFRQDEVRHPDRHVLAGKRIDRRAAGVESFLLDRAVAPGLAIQGAELRHPAAEGLRIRALARESVHERVFRGQQDEGRAIDGVDARGEDLDARVAAGDRERDAGALGSADPVALHHDDLLGPLRQRLEAGQQFVRVLGDPEEPLFQLPRHDRRPAPPAGAVDDLLVGQDGVVDGTPVDGRAPAVCQPALEHLQEDPLVELVVIGQTRRDLALPGVADAQTLQLPFHVGDVGERGGLRMGARLDRRVLGRQPERVPSKRMQHIETAHPLHARHHVADDVVADVSDVRVPRGVRKHLQAIELGPAAVDVHLERLRCRPMLLPLLVELLGFELRH